MLSHTFYKNIQESDKMYGLELVDLYALIIFFNLSFLFSSSFLVNIIVTAIFFFTLRIFKKNKPKNYTTDLINYWKSRKRLIPQSVEPVKPYIHTIRSNDVLQ